MYNNGVKMASNFGILIGKLAYSRILSSEEMIILSACLSSKFFAMSCMLFRVASCGANNNTGKFFPNKIINEAVLKCEFLDADMDDNLDIITISRDNVNKLWINKGSGKFELSEQIFGDNRTLSLGCADFDGDGDIDIVFGQMEGTGGNAIYFNQSVSDN